VGCPNQAKYESPDRNLSEGCDNMAARKDDALGILEKA